MTQHAALSKKQVIYQEDPLRDRLIIININMLDAVTKHQKKT